MKVLSVKCVDDDDESATFRSQVSLIFEFVKSLLIWKLIIMMNIGDIIKSNQCCSVQKDLK